MTGQQVALAPTWEPARARRLVSGTLWSGVATVAPRLAAVVTTPIVVHGLGLARVGLVAFVAALTTVMSMLVAGTTGAAQRRLTTVTETDGKAPAQALARRLLLRATLTGLPVAVALVALAGPISGHVLGADAGADAGAFYVRVQGLGCLLAPATGIVTAVLFGQKRFRAVAVVASAGAVAAAVTTAVAVHAGGGLRAVGVVGLAAQLLMLGASLAQTSFLGIGHSRHDTAVEARGFGRLSLQLSIVSSLSIIDQSSDGLVIGVTQSAAATGLYGVGSAASQALRSLSVTALSPLLAELLTAFARDGRAAAGELFLSTQRVWVRLSTLTSCVAVGFSYAAVETWLGPGYQRAALICLLLAAGDMVNLWTGALTCFLNAVDRVDVEVRYGLVALAGNVVLTLALAVTGSVGIVAATAAGEVLGSLALVRLARPHLSPRERRSFVSEVPVLPAMCVLVASVGTAYALRSVVPQGVSGLACLAAAAGLILAISLCADTTVREAVLPLAKGRPASTAPAGRP